jgi:hypothetical protein
VPVRADTCEHWRNTCGHVPVRADTSRGLRNTCRHVREFTKYVPTRAHVRHVAGLPRAARCRYVPTRAEFMRHVPTRAEFMRHVPGTCRTWQDTCQNTCQNTCATCEHWRNTCGHVPVRADRAVVCETRADTCGYVPTGAGVYEVRADSCPRSARGGAATCRVYESRVATCRYVPTRAEFMRHVPVRAARDKTRVKIRAKTCADTCGYVRTRAGTHAHVRHMSAWYVRNWSHVPRAGTCRHCGCLRITCGRVPTRACTCRDRTFADTLNH